MRRVLISFIAGSFSFVPSLAIPQQKPSLAPAPKTVTVAQLKDAGQLDGQLVQLNSVVVRHTNTSQVFTFGDKQGPEMHVVIPNPAVDSANIGDTLVVMARSYIWMRAPGRIQSAERAKPARTTESDGKSIRRGAVSTVL